jgi:hypothetical protein
MGACNHSITPAAPTLNFGCGEKYQYEAAAQWLVFSNSSSSNRRTQRDLVELGLLAVRGCGETH